MGQLAPEEARSIQSAGLPPVPSADAAVARTALDAYLAIKQRRRETGVPPVRNPGAYVRSIARKQLSEREGRENTPSLVDATANGGQQRREPVGPHETRVEACLKKHDIGPTEINEKCRLALHGGSAAVAESALQAYAHQKQRRAARGTQQIADASSYVLAVMR
jgi:hypothetical protein